MNYERLRRVWGRKNVKFCYITRNEKITQQKTTKSQLSHDFIWVKLDPWFWSYGQFKWRSLIIGTFLYTFIGINPHPAILSKFIKNTFWSRKLWLLINFIWYHFVIIHYTSYFFKILKQMHFLILPQTATFKLFILKINRILILNAIFHQMVSKMHLNYCFLIKSQIVST